MLIHRRLLVRLNLLLLGINRITSLLHYSYSSNLMALYLPSYRLSLGKAKIIVLLETHEYRPNLFNINHIGLLCTILEHFIDPGI
jgi:hypothetical protein